MFYLNASEGKKWFYILMFAISLLLACS